MPRPGLSRSEGQGQEHSFIEEKSENYAIHETRQEDPKQRPRLEALRELGVRASFVKHNTTHPAINRKHCLLLRGLQAQTMPHLKQNYNQDLCMSQCSTALARNIERRMIVEGPRTRAYLP